MSGGAFVLFVATACYAPLYEVTNSIPATPHQHRLIRYFNRRACSSMIPYGLGFCQLLGRSVVGELPVAVALDNPNGLSALGVPHLDLLVGSGCGVECLELGVHWSLFLFGLCLKYDMLSA